MVQPNYNPEEALQRVKLMMGYDSSKTLTENKQSIGLLNEQLPWGILSNKTSIDNVLNSCPTFVTQDDEGNLNFEKIKPSMKNDEWSDIATIWQTSLYKKYGPIPGTDDDPTTGWPKALSLMGAKGNMADLCAIKTIYETSTGADFAQDIDEDLNSGDVMKVVGVFQKMNRRGLNTTTLPVDIAAAQNISWWKGKFPCLFFTGSIVDNKPVVDGGASIYILIKSSSGKTYRLYHNNQLKDSDGVKVLNKKIRCGENNRVIIESEEKKNLLEQGFDDSALNPPTPSPTGTPRPRRETPKPKFPPCQNGRYVLGCSSEVVRQVQECLGFMVVDQDGKFGKITQAALQKLGFAGGFTDKDVEKICKKVEEDPALSVADTFNEPDTDFND
jgi:hypothetical protein